MLFLEINSKYIQQVLHIVYSMCKEKKIFYIYDSASKNMLVNSFYFLSNTKKIIISTEDINQKIINCEIYISISESKVNNLDYFTLCYLFLLELKYSYKDCVNSMKLLLESNEDMHITSLYSGYHCLINDFINKDKVLLKNFCDYYNYYVCKTLLSQGKKLNSRAMQIFNYMYENEYSSDVIFKLLDKYENLVF